VSNTLYFALWHHSCHDLQYTIVHCSIVSNDDDDPCSRVTLIHLLHTTKGEMKGIEIVICCMTWGFHGAAYEVLCFVGCNAVKSGGTQSSEASVDFHDTTRTMPQKIELFKKYFYFRTNRTLDNYELFSVHPLRVSLHEKDLNHVQWQACACWWQLHYLHTLFIHFHGSV
jgi:hypothetical protein